MADAVEIKLDEKRLDEIRKMLRDIPNAMPKVMSRGINRTGTSVRAEIVRKIAANTKLRQKDVKKGISTTKATRTRWEYTIKIKKKGIPLIYFKPKEKKKTVSIKTTAKQAVFLFSKVFVPKYGLAAIFSFDYTIKRKLGFVTADTGKGKEEIEGGFIATLKSGHKGVFRRTGKGRAIEQVYGPSAGELFEGAAGIAAEVQESATEKLTKNIDQQIAFILSRRKTG